MERMDGSLKEPGTEIEGAKEMAPYWRFIVALAVARDILKALQHLAKMRIARARKFDARTHSLQKI
jgi:hypothetical protein